MSIDSVVDYVRELTQARPRPWLVVGKGPSMDRLAEVPVTLFHVLTLNHACRIVPPALAHFVDAEALEECLPALEHVCVVLPWHPHAGFRAGKRPLDAYPWAEGFGRRLLSYNATTVPEKYANPALPTITLKGFSATAAFGILLAAGERDVYSIGVDGGTGYSKAFDAKTLLANGQKSFDVQTPVITKAVNRHAARWTKLPIL